MLVLYPKTVVFFCLCSTSCEKTYIHINKCEMAMVLSSLKNSPL
ncbi:hypothetical protein HanRHA438_Chr04g0176721 [Helianthus annuus]|nr:hypothetical protein HanRHA438_Chr04g0176721 [Helianthus annuus]